MARGNKNQVTLSFAGESSDLEKSFDRVGASADSMSQEVDESGRRVRSAGEGFDKFGEASDAADQRAMGFRDTMTGVQDTMKGTGQIARGNLFEGFMTLGMGIGDLASGFANFLIPALKNATKAGIANAASTVRQTAANASHRVSVIASTAATKAMTVAQRALNLVMRANPIGIVVTVLAALAAGLTYAWKNSETFRNIVRGAMDGVVAAFNWVLDRGQDIVGFFANLPGNIARFFSGIGDIISRPFVAAFNWVRDLWNSTLGGTGFTIPGWVPGIGGNSFRIPTMHQGGVVPGAPGSERLTMLQAGEKVTPANRQPQEVVLRSDGSAFSELVLETVRNAVRGQGGDVQIVLGQ